MCCSQKCVLRQCPFSNKKLRTKITVPLEIQLDIEPDDVSPETQEYSLEEVDLFPPGEEPNEFIDKVETVPDQVEDHNNEVELTEGNIQIELSGDNVEAEISMETHEAIGVHIKPKIYKCDKCGKPFARYSYAKSHCQIKVAWTCEICGKEIQQQNNVARHKDRCRKQALKHQTTIPSTQPESVEQRCSLCGITFKNIASLKTHNARKHRESIEGELKCEQCDFKTNSKSHLKKHMTQKHEAYREEFKCDRCDYICFSKDGLRKHKRIVHMRAGEKAVSESVVLNLPSGATAAGWGAVGEEAAQGGGQEPAQGGGQEPARGVGQEPAQGGGQELQHILSGVPVEGQVSTDGDNVLLDLDTGTYVINNDFYVIDESISMTENVLEFSEL